MANFTRLTDFLKSDLAKGLAIGAGVAGIAALAAPVVARAARPLLRSAVKSGILFAEISREVFAEATESLDDIVAEVRSELAERHVEAADIAAAVAEAAEAVVTPDSAAD